MSVDIASYKMDSIRSELPPNTIATEQTYQAALDVHYAGYNEAFRLIKDGLEAKAQAGMRVNLGSWRDGKTDALNIYAGELKAEGSFDNDIIVTFKETEIDIPSNTTRVYVYCGKNAWYGNDVDRNFELFFAELGFKSGEYKQVAKHDPHQGRYYDVPTTRLLDVLGIDQKQFLLSVNTVRNETAAKTELPITESRWNIFRPSSRPTLTARPLELSQKLTA